MKKYLTWDDIDKSVDKLCDKVDKDVTGVFGIPRGDLIIAVMISHKLNIPYYDELRGLYGSKFLLVDDIADTGKTLGHYTGLGFGEMVTGTIHYHKQSSIEPDYWVDEKGDDWIVYPWEQDDSEEIQDYLV